MMEMIYRAEIYFSYYQSKDSKIKNWIRKLKLKKTLREILNSIGIDYASIIPLTGIYRGKSEPSFLVKLYDVPEYRIVELATKLKNYFNQDNVLVEIENIEKESLRKL